MNIELNFEQRARLELISIHSGKTPGQVLIDAAQSLFNHNIGYIPSSLPDRTQQFVSEEMLETRFSRLLGRR